jgi:hypothetical protein
VEIEKHVQLFTEQLNEKLDVKASYIDCDLEA